jgi:hypothetical protein
MLQEFVDYTSINNLLNTTKSFEIIKKQSYYWKLDMTYSLKYYCSLAGGTNTFDRRFKLKLNSLLTNVNKQLSLNLSNLESRIDMSVIANVNALNLKGSRNVVNFSSLGKVQTLDIRKCDSNQFDFSVFGGVQNLLWLDAHDGDDFHDDDDDNDDDDDDDEDEDDDDDDDDDGEFCPIRQWEEL